MVLGNLAVASDIWPSVWLMENLRDINPLGFPVIDRLFGLQYIGAAHHFIDSAEAQLRHNLPQFLSDEGHKVDRVLGIAREVLPQGRILGRHTNGAGVFVAHPHHDAAEGYQWCRGEAVLFCAEEGGDRHVSPGLNLTVRFYGDAAAQIIQHQGLVGFRQAQFPGEARMFDRGLGRRSCATVKTRDQHHIGVSFCHPSGDSANPHFRHQFDADPCFAIGVLEIVDELR